jgi:hypothetical protein
VFNATFSNISDILWWSVLLVEETRIHGENHQPVTTKNTGKYDSIGDKKEKKHVHT